MDKNKEILDGFSKELKLLVPLLQSNLLQDAACVHKADFDFINWEKFIELVRHHRVRGQIYQAIQEQEIVIPAHVLASLKSLNRANGINALKNTGEILELRNLFEQEKIPFIIFKGILLSQQLYNNTGFRHTGDIDFLIKHENVNNVDRILSQNGYTRIFPRQGLTPKQLKIFIIHHHHFEYFNKTKKIRLEAHWDFFFNKQLYKPDYRAIFNKPLVINIAGTSLPTLPVRENIIYLMIHGSLHGYFRLFWLYDIAALYYKDKEINWEVTYNEMKKVGLERIFEQTFYLMNILWSMPAPKFIASDKHKLSVNYLTNTALKIINYGENYFDGTATQRLQKNLYQMIMKKSVLYKLSPLARQLTSYHDWALIQFPDKFFFLYYIFRPLFIITALLKKDYFKKANKSLSEEN